MPITSNPGWVSDGQVYAPSLEGLKFTHVIPRLQLRGEAANPRCRFGGSLTAGHFSIIPAKAVQRSHDTYLAQFIGLGVRFETPTQYI